MPSRPKRFELISLLPVVLWIGFIVFNEKGMWPSDTVRIIYGLTFIVSFYAVAIYLIFRKNLSKWLILLLLIPFTAVITFVVLVFLKPREKGEDRPSPATFDQL